MVRTNYHFLDLSYVNVPGEIWLLSFTPSRLFTL